MLAGGEAVLVERGQDLVGIAPEDGGHAGGGLRGRGGHGPAALADEDHRLLGRDDTGGRRSGDLADRVAGADPDLAVGVGRVREEGQERDQTGRYEQRLGDGGVGDLLRVPSVPRRTRSRPEQTDSH